MANERYDLPPPSLLPDSTVRMPFYLVGDDIYPLKRYLMKPFPGRRLTKADRIFNGRLSRARRCIENAFGIMANKWRLLHKATIATREHACSYFRAICCLHNYCRMEMDVRYGANSECIDNDGELIVSNMGKLKKLPMQRNLKTNHAEESATQQRERLRDYVNGIGAVLWQNCKYAKYYYMM
jgi:hypothetical protein